MVYQARRMPMEALEVERSRAEGEQALQARITFARENAGRLEAHAAEKGLFTGLRPSGLAAMQRYFAERGTGDAGPALLRDDGAVLPMEQRLRGRDSLSIFGKFRVIRPCSRTPGEPGILPLDAQVNRPGRCYSYFVQAWRTVFAVEHPCQERAGCCAQHFALEGAARVWRPGARRPLQTLRASTRNGRCRRRNAWENSWW
jgi:hypothetical protein